MSMSRRRLTCCCFDDVENPRPPSDGNVNTHKLHLSPHQILYQAANNGDWKTAQKVLDGHLHYACDAITRRGDTVLHVAAMAKQTSFVRKLVRMLDKTDLVVKNLSGSTAFCCAVWSGVVENARVMADKNPQLPTIRSYNEMTPIHQAAFLGHKEMVSYLYTLTPLDQLLPEERIEILEVTIRYNMYDAALNILRNDTRFACAKLDGNRSLMHTLARKRIARKGEMGICGRFLGSTCALFSTRLWKRIEEKYLAKQKAYELLEEIWKEYLKAEEDKLLKVVRETEVFHYVAKEGNVEFLDMILQSKPDLFWEINKSGQSILHVAVLYRQQNVVDYICNNKHVFKDLMTLLFDENYNNILHLAAMDERTFCKYQFSKVEELVPEKKEVAAESSVLVGLSTAALQFERVISWFKEVEKIVPPSFRDMRNRDGKTPKQLFLEEHMELRMEAEKSIRGTAKSCMLVATLIATVAFSAAFTVPGGTDDRTGVPILRKQASFTVFTISDAVAMIYSMVSIVTFLSILILRFTDDNFHFAMRSLFLGLAALGVSIGGMLFSFTAAFFLVYNKAWQPILIAAFAPFPIALFLFLNTKLWTDALGSMFHNLFGFTKQY